jgi:hypothetical protein
MFLGRDVRIEKRVDLRVKGEQTACQTQQHEQHPDPQAEVLVQRMAPMSASGLHRHSFMLKVKNALRGIFAA